ncbi:hypothetical protein RhiirA5_381404 [Rhizophagus irregularis]|uniref:Uncharacterized protein n=1 Tax=Rhizophagus irregularis TaxID=588596 RepID=A0A2N0P4U5_9GLOM|nr:hypothetical protein RhiirA5_381404 [Rhizophagus irregularis]
MYSLGVIFRELENRFDFEIKIKIMSDILTDKRENSIPGTNYEFVALNENISIFFFHFKNCVKKITDTLYWLQYHQNGNWIYAIQRIYFIISAQTLELRQCFDNKSNRLRTKVWTRNQIVQSLTRVLICN